MIVIVVGIDDLLLKGEEGTLFLCMLIAHFVNLSTPSLYVSFFF